MFDYNSAGNRLRRLYRERRGSDTMLGIAMAAIAVLFIAGIVTAFIYAADTNPVQSAGTAAPVQKPTGPGGAAG